MINNNDELHALLRLDAAVRVLQYVKEYCPGDDLGAGGIALATLEMYAAIKQIDRIRGCIFDAKAAYQELVSND